MADFGAISIPLTLAALSAAGAAYGAHQQNKAKKSAEGSAMRAAETKKSQINEAAELERKKRSIESAQIRGRLAVVGASSGADPSGSYSALDRQAEFDRDFNIDIIKKNQVNEIARVSSGLDADLTRLSASGRNEILEGFAGGIGGAQTGISVYNALPEQANVDKWLERNIG